MNYNDLLQKIKNSGVSLTEFAYEDVSKEIRKEIGEWKEIQQHGGEGEGSDWYSVKHFSEHDIYIKVSGHYTSFNGTDFDGFDDACSEVKPVEKKVTFYEAI